MIHRAVVSGCAVVVGTMGAGTLRCIDRYILIMCRQLELCMYIIILSRWFGTGRIGTC